ncbi:hypothetical protein AAFC00_005330 [Neodothiora populina]|uniref:Zn(2)-C6 fungal-type domain-containing protein n=1 Tax=Neodothiora populina TaxID=2781224 RepID=A0ABR3PKI5_9PEZI
MSDLALNSDGPDPIGLDGLKRKATDAGLPANGSRPHKSVKRRASKACQSCRARKVRCNVVEQSPCTNCRLDEVECIVSESKRKRKWSKPGNEDAEAQCESRTRESNASAYSPSSVHGISKSSISFQDSGSHHVPHSLYQDLEPHSFQDGARSRSHARSISIPQDPIDSTAVPSMDRTASFTVNKPQSPVSLANSLPSFIKAIPTKYGVDDIAYLVKKGALTLPSPPLRNALLECFMRFVHPYMPLLDLHDLLDTIERNDENTAISLLLFQAIMFASTASVDIKYLKAAGYMTRRDARRDFFQKTRLLYDFDYETDRISLIQALLLMTYWYETPDDQKDSHHWMGIAVSLSHTIGLHRNPERSNMGSKRKRLWKRIWWSTFMRDRLIALGMRRPTRIKNEDFDVPMLAMEDFDIKVRPATSSSVVNCKLQYDTNMQRNLAIMCIEKAKLCICISHVLSTQYSVLHNNHGLQNSDGNTKSTMLLVARKDDPEGSEVRSCDERLRRWKSELAPEAEYHRATAEGVARGEDCVMLNRSLLHMVYFATLSALHRPQVLPSTAWPARKAALEVLDTSRKTVRYAANKITSIAQNLAETDLVRFLPTSGITVLLPAIIIHLLDIKAPEEATRRASLQGFCQCMHILNKLRDIYAAADYSTAFLEAAIRKAEITLPKTDSEATAKQHNMPVKDQMRINKQIAGLSRGRLPRVEDTSRLTPPPDIGATNISETATNAATAAAAAAAVADITPGIEPTPTSDEYLAQSLTRMLASTPPDSDSQLDTSFGGANPAAAATTTTTTTTTTTAAAAAAALGSYDLGDFEPDFDALVNLDAAGEAFALDDGAFPVMAGEGAGFSLDNMDWMKGLTELEDAGLLDTETPF